MPESFNQSAISAKRRPVLKATEHLVVDGLGRRVLPEVSITLGTHGL